MLPASFKGSPERGAAEQSEAGGFRPKDGFSPVSEPLRPFGPPPLSGEVSDDAGSVVSVTFLFDDAGSVVLAGSRRTSNDAGSVVFIITCKKSQYFLKIFTKLLLSLFPNSKNSLYYY